MDGMHRSEVENERVKVVFIFLAPFESRITLSS